MRTRYREHEESDVAEAHANTERDTERQTDRQTEMFLLGEVAEVSQTPQCKGWRLFARRKANT